jgi:D-glycero-D-manno-heptose 1,7-bisphosphate phosphatase
MSREDVLLDRDGVIIRSRSDYVKSWDEVEIFGGALDAIARLCQAGHRVIVITNQSAVGRGILPPNELAGIHRRLSLLVARNGGEISGYFVCPHLPSDHCSCRKPQPGLLLQAKTEMAADLRSAFVVGDQLSDLEAAWSVGSHPVLVLSGETHASPTNPGGNYLLASDLSEAADLILSATEGNGAGMHPFAGSAHDQ